ncbi:hypothetical protein diail_3077 [Diaporthe ilicicola]|nr:hypothetical protein diail_3077 [Diaporthe ilicicola]
MGMDEGADDDLQAWGQGGKEEDNNNEADVDDVDKDNFKDEIPVGPLVLWCRGREKKGGSFTENQSYAAQAQLGKPRWCW